MRSHFGSKRGNRRGCEGGTRNWNLSIYFYICIYFLYYLDDGNSTIY